ncbi:IS66 family element, transposase domain protein [Leptospira weilii serovar Topaz str. LT2116]|uniref:IS66 family element, transposase domain protein n=1 Tax=Leptospira weilii serovar Topaz str. LT2116 TaxID=1088540 RepID=M3FJB0_9LEPT|nr:IS66 family element, transposase domain protein [Leptospira weilii serovar Topaz str. LT2116]
MLSSGFLAYTITQKFADALPFYRQAGILQRSGVEISRSTLSNTAIQVFEKLSPMIEDVRRELFQSKYLQIDETVLQSVKRRRKAKLLQIVYVGDSRFYPRKAGCSVSL